MEIKLLKILRSVLGFVLAGTIYATAQIGGIMDSPFFIFVFIITMVVSAFLYFVHKLTNSVEQENRDEKVKYLYERIITNEGEPFILYLRPFISMGKIKKANWHSDLFDYKAHVADDSNELESVLLESTKSIAPLICVGKPGEFHGIGRLEMNENEWKEEISDLLLQAKLIFCIPSWREGTKWEFEFLQNNYLFSKTIFIVPGNNQSVWQSDSLDEEWFKTQQLYKKEFDINLPNYIGNTKFFKLNIKKEIYKESEVNLNENNLIGLIKFFEK